MAVVKYLRNGYVICKQEPLDNKVGYVELDDLMSTVIGCANI